MNCDWDIAKLLIFSDNIEPLIYYSHVTSIIIFTCLIGFTFLNLRKWPKNSFRLMAGSYILWLFCDLVLWANEGVDNILFFWTIINLVEPVIFVGAYAYFTEFVNKNSLSIRQKWLVFGLLLPTIIMAPIGLSVVGFDFTNCDRNVVEGIAAYYNYFLEVFFILGIIVTTIIGLSKNKNRKERTKLLVMSGGMSLLLLSFLAANFSGTLFNEYTISQYGHIAVPIFAAFLAYVTIKYEAFEPRILFIDTLVAALVILLISLFFVEDQNYQIYVNIITLLIVIPLGYSLVTGIRKETSARKQIELQEKELELANTHLKELDKLKSEFVSLATHQIRAPLTAIKGYLSEIFEGDFGPLPPALQPPLNTMMQSNENLINIVGDFLNISRIEQGRMVYEFSSFDLGTVTKEVGDSLKPNLDRAHLDFSVEVEPNHNYIVSGDIGKTKQIIGNIIDNAIKYTPQGWIKLQVTKTPAGMVRVTIKDSGVGVTADTIPKLFQKFSRATDANKTNVVGTGLGLYVVKTMVEAQHGKVWVESEGAGKGSTFIVEFPAVHVS